MPNTSKQFKEIPITSWKIIDEKWWRCVEMHTNSAKIVATITPLWEDHIKKVWWEATINEISIFWERIKLIIQTIQNKIKNCKPEIRINKKELMDMTEFSSKWKLFNNMLLVESNLEDMIDWILSQWKTSIKKWHNSWIKIVTNEKHIPSNWELINSIYLEWLYDQLQIIMKLSDSIINKCDIFRALIKNTHTSNERLSINTDLCSFTPNWSNYRKLEEIIEGLNLIWYIFHVKWV